LGQAIESCLGQKPAGYEVEVLVIDDGSTDETPAVCKRYFPAIRVIRSDNLGFGASLTRAITEASGEYVCLLDADDYFASDKLARLGGRIQSGRLFITHHAQMIDENGTVLVGRIGTGGNTSTLCVHRKAALSLCPAESELSFHPLNEAGHGETVPEILAFYRFHKSSMMRTHRADHWYNFQARVTHSLASRLQALSKSPPFWGEPKLLRAISNAYRSMAYYDEMEASLLAGNWPSAVSRIPSIFRFAFRSKNGIRTWHWKVAVRGLLNRAIRLEQPTH